MKVCTKLLFVVLAGIALAGCGGSDDPTPDAAEISDAVTPDAPPAETGDEIEVDAPTATAVPTAEPAAPEPAAAEPAPEAAAEPRPTPTTVPDPVVYQDDFATSIAPIFASKCASCHNEGGPGATHWQLENAADLVATHEWIASVVSTGYMPPWPASELSLVFHDNRSLRPDQIRAISEWSTAGAPLDVGEATVIRAPEGVVALDADVEIGPHESYQGSTDVADDYRCFIYDLGLDEPRWMQGYEFVPDQTQIVHHAIGYLAPKRALDRANRLSEQDDLGGWQCYGGSGLGTGDDLFLGWAPGQLPTRYPEGSGLLARPGDFIVLQIHYHFDDAGPEDASTIRLDWADGDNLDPIDFGEFIGPAEIPCASTESGPLCDRRAALARAYERYGVEGVLADGINNVCGVRPEDFAGMTDGIAASECTIPVRDFGEIVSVFGHEHEIGSSIRMTLNAGRPDERILLDIPDWSFDWQYNYYPVESIMLEPGDTVLLECEWDRSRRDPELEPAYVLWADGTNDEMCFATISTRRTDPRSSRGDESAAGLDLDGVEPVVPEELATCMRDAGVPIDEPLDRNAVDATADQLFTCAEPAEVGQLLSSLISDNFGGLVGDDGIDCLADGFSTPEGARELLTFTLDDATDSERVPVGELVADCVSLSDALAKFGFPLPESTRACVDDVGRDLLIKATIEGELPEEQTLFGAINPCLASE